MLLATGYLHAVFYVGGYSMGCAGTIGWVWTPLVRCTTTPHRLLWRCILLRVTAAKCGLECRQLDTLPIFVAQLECLSNCVCLWSQRRAGALYTWTPRPTMVRSKAPKKRHSQVCFVHVYLGGASAPIPLLPKAVAARTLLLTAWSPNCCGWGSVVSMTTHVWIV